MFDVSFSELLLIGVIALIVIGPERLPKVARTIGHLVGRAQRYVNDVKTDIQREMNVEEITSLKGQMEEAANTVKSSIAAAGDSLRNPIDEAKEALKDAQSSLKDATESVNAALNPAQPEPPAPNTAPVETESKTETNAETAADATAAATLPLPGMEDPTTLVSSPASKSTTGTPT
jgi:sec-independent protein translocase protein TatB